MTGMIPTDPIKFADVLKSQRVVPGDVLRLLPGTYKGDWIIPAAFAGVTMKPNKPNTVTIDGSLTVEAENFQIYDMDFTDSRTDRTVILPGITCNYPGFGLFGCRVTDLHDSGVSWFGGGAGSVSENVILNNGYMDAAGVGHGHAIYTHNDPGGAKQIARNLLGDQWGKYSLHVYSGGNNYLRDYTVEDNVIWGNPAICGGGMGLTNYVCQRNIQFGDYWYQGRYSLQPNDGGVIRDNLFIGLWMYSVQSTFKNLVEENNIVWNVNGYGEPSARAGYTVEETPKEWSRFIPFTLSERWAGIQVTLTAGVFDAKVVER